jgi:hypothetical protein
MPGNVLFRITIGGRNDRRSDLDDGDHAEHDEQETQAIPIRCSRPLRASVIAPRLARNASS